MSLTKETDMGEQLELFETNESKRLTRFWESVPRRDRRAVLDALAQMASMALQSERSKRRATAGISARTTAKERNAR
jgi:hypothetical protein